MEAVARDKSEIGGGGGGRFQLETVVRDRRRWPGRWGRGWRRRRRPWKMTRKDEKIVRRKMVCERKGVEMNNMTCGTGIIWVD